MPIPVTCPDCGKSFKVKDEYAGRRGKCPACKSSVTVPAAAEPEPVAPPPPPPAGSVWDAMDDAPIQAEVVAEYEAEAVPEADPANEFGGLEEVDPTPIRTSRRRQRQEAPPADPDDRPARDDRDYDDDYDYRPRRPRGDGGRPFSEAEFWPAFRRTMSLYLVVLICYAASTGLFAFHAFVAMIDPQAAYGDFGKLIVTLAWLGAFGGAVVALVGRLSLLSPPPPNGNRMSPGLWAFVFAVAAAVLGLIGTMVGVFDAWGVTDVAPWLKQSMTKAWLWCAGLAEVFFVLFLYTLAVREKDERAADATVGLFNRAGLLGAILIGSMVVLGTILGLAQKSDSALAALSGLSLSARGIGFLMSGVGCAIFVFLFFMRPGYQRLIDEKAPPPVRPSRGRRDYDDYEDDYEDDRPRGRRQPPRRQEDDDDYEDDYDDRPRRRRR